jgi:hypothetical protein
MAWTCHSRSSTYKVLGLCTLKNNTKRSQIFSTALFMYTLSINALQNAFLSKKLTSHAKACQKRWKSTADKKGIYDAITHFTL